MKLIAALIALSATAFSVIALGLFLVAVGTLNLPSESGRSLGVEGQIACGGFAVLCLVAGCYAARVAYLEAQSNREHEERMRQLYGR